MGGTARPELANALDNLASVLAKQGRMEEAENKCRLAVRLREKVRVGRLTPGGGQGPWAEGAQAEAWGGGGVRWPEGTQAEAWGGGAGSAGRKEHRLRAGIHVESSCLPVNLPVNLPVSLPVNLPVNLPAHHSVPVRGHMWGACCSCKCVHLQLCMCVNMCVSACVHAVVEV